MAQIGLTIGVAGGAAKLSISLFSIAAAIGTAGVEVRAFASNASSLAQVLTNLSDALVTKEPISPKAKTIADGLITLCQTILDDSSNLLKRLRPLVELTGSAQKRFILRIRWVFEKSKFATHLQSLEALKSTLSLLIGTVNYSDGVASNRPRDIQISLRLQLQNVASEEIQNSNRVHQNVSRLMQRESPLLTGNPLKESRESQPLKLRRIPDDSINGEEDESQSVDPGLDSLSLEPSEVEKSIIVHSKNVENEEEVEREFGIEELDIVTPYLEISLLQQRTIQFATLVLRAEEDRATADDINAPNDQGSSNSQDGTRLSNPPPPQSHMEHMNGTVIYNSGNPESLDQQQSVASSETASVAAENVPTTKAEVTNVAYGSLLFTDARGTRYTLPLSDCKTWEGMVNILREIYTSDDYWGYELKSEVEKRNKSGLKLGLQPFILLGGRDYAIILPRHWTSIVHSAYSVTMRFDDPRLNTVPDPRVEELQRFDDPRLNAVPDPRVEGLQKSDDPHIKALTRVKGLQGLVAKVRLWDKLVKKRRDAD
ncbi:hypothetical protein VE01_07593 [Pseudogymnoascus verrucosus]|uniref:Ubiquitin-like domain-containing protein n=1 Tax=Pseudogymnoascus verrucosus TaxID=342668 RepID=A0A1B8GHE9_9PEZI|nr:uncharacterized protein VE01_07593 [Pseudogymnoascus verrucosus]OBT95244.1 hypothetical protein VE01_07593 [Pseudogymnoascus verrucosus]